MFSKSDEADPLFSCAHAISICTISFLSRGLRLAVRKGFVPSWKRQDGCVIFSAFAELPLVSFHTFAVKKRVLDMVPQPHSACVAAASCVNTPTRGTLLYFSVETLTSRTTCSPLRRFCRNSIVVFKVVGKSSVCVSRSGEKGMWWCTSAAQQHCCSCWKAGVRRGLCVWRLSSGTR